MALRLACLTRCDPTARRPTSRSPSTKALRAMRPPQQAYEPEAEVDGLLTPVRRRRRLIGNRNRLTRPRTGPAGRPERAVWRRVCEHPPAPRRPAGDDAMQHA